MIIRIEANQNRCFHYWSETFSSAFYAFDE